MYLIVGVSLSVPSKEEVENETGLFKPYLTSSVLEVSRNNYRHDARKRLTNFGHLADVLTNAEAETMVTLADVKAFNNAGAACIKAHRTKEAWELLKGALEALRLLQQEESAFDANCSESAQKFVQCAESHIESLDYYIEHPLEYKQDTTDHVFDAFKTQYPSIMAERFLFLQPFLVKEDTTDPLQISAVITFNMAVIQHRDDRTSYRGYELYRVALTLVAADPTVSFFVSSILNNVLVWLYENGHTCEIEGCIRELTLRRSSWESFGDTSEGIQSNVDAIVSARTNDLSPAA